MSLVEPLPGTEAWGRRLFPPRRPAVPGPSRRGFAALALAVLLVPLAVLALPLFSRQVYTLDDLGDFHLPLRSFYARCLARGEDFTWCPQLQGGFYLHGEGQAGLYHPLHLLLYSALPLDVAFNLELLLNYPILFLGSYLFLRRCCVLPREASLFGAAAFTFSGFNLLHFPHVNALSVIAHVPWQLLALRAALRGRPGQAVLGRLGVSLLTASQLLLGYPQYVWLSSLLEVVYVLFLLRPWPGWGRLLGLGAAKVVGILGGGVQLLPTWDCLTHSVREAPTWDFLAKGSMMPANLAQLLAPYLFLSRVVSYRPELCYHTHEYGLYAGVLVLLLALWAVVRVRRLPARRRRLAQGALGVGALALVLSFGSYSPLFSLYTRLPLVGLFRYPGRYTLLVHAALAVLAAVAFADLARRRQAPGEPGALATGDRRQSRLWPLALLPLAGLLLVLSAKGYALAQPRSLLAHVLAGAGPAFLGVLLAAAAAGLVAAAARGRRWALPALLLFTVADQAGYGLSYIRHWEPCAVADFQGREPYPAAAPHRLANGHEDNAPLLRGESLVEGYVALAPRRELDPAKESTLRLAGAGWRRTEEEWQAVPRPLPRARLVACAVGSDRPAADLDAIDPETTALVDPAAAVSLDLEATAPRGEAVLTCDRPGDVRVSTEAGSRQLLVLAESCHEGWQASIDGRPCPVVRVYGDFMGCVVGPGRHAVEFRFRPWSLRAGAWLSALGGVFMLLMLPSLARRANSLADLSRRLWWTPSTWMS